METIAGIDAVLGQRPRALGILLQQDVPVVVEVADDGHGNTEAVEAVHDVRHGRGSSVVVDGDAHQFGTGAGQSRTLPDGAVNVGGVGVGHGLHHNWCIAADADPTNGGCISFSALNLGHTGATKSVTRNGQIYLRRAWKFVGAERSAGHLTKWNYRPSKSEIMLGVLRSEFPVDFGA